MTDAGFPPPIIQPVSLLYVDDEEDLLMLGKLFLERTGEFTVDTLTSAYDALKSPLIQSYDAIISDYQMPGMDGIAFLKAIRQQNPKIPFIIYTGRGREEVVIEAINNGADFYQQKGGDTLSQFAELAQKIRQAVHRRWAEKSLQESEERFRVLAESSPVAIMVHQDNRFVYVNEHMTRITGYSLEELYSSNFWEIVHPDFQDKVKEFGFARLQGADIPTRYEVPFLTKSGQIRWGDLSAGLIQYNEKAALIALVVDITQKKKTEVELHAAYEQLAASDEELRAQFEELKGNAEKISQSEQNYRSIVDNLPGAFYRINMEGNILMLTPSFAEQFGFSNSKDLIGKNVRDFFYLNPSDRDRVLNKLTTYGSVRNERILMKRPDGGQGVTAISSRLLSDEKGIPTGIEGIIQDVTHTVEVEEALAESEKLLHLLENNIQDVIWTADMEMNLTYITPSVMIQRGYTQEEALNISLKDSVTPESYSIIMRNRQEVLELLQKGKPGPDRQIMELDFLHKDGYPVKTEVVITPAFDRNGIPVGVIGVSRDIRKRKNISFVDSPSLNKDKEAFRQQELQYANAMDLAHLVNWDLDVETGIFYFDDRFYSLYGTSRSREGGSRMSTEDYVLNFVHPEDIPFVLHIIKESMEGIRPEYTELEHRIVRRDGEIRTIIVRYRICTDKTGKIVRIYGANQDITERKIAEQKLRESEERYRQIFETLEDLYYQIDNNGIITTLSPSLYRLTGFKPEELIGQPVSQVYDCPEDREKLLQEIAKKGYVWDYELNLRKRDGTLVTTSLSATRIFDEQGSIVGISGIIRDISERKQIERALRLANKKLNLLSSITRHDINNQLAALNAYLFLSKDEINNPSTLTDYLNKEQILTNSIIHQIAFTGDYENMGIHAPVWQNVYEIVEKIIQMLSLENVIINRVNPSLEIFADSMLEKVFYNLVDNALHYAGKEEITILIHEEKEIDDLTILVIDNGTGIAPEDKEEIFEKGVGKNTGLGLFLTREILSITNITIRETGVYGEGSRFEICVPRGEYRI